MPENTAVDTNLSTAQTATVLPFAARGRMSATDLKAPDLTEPEKGGEERPKRRAKVGAPAPEARERSTITILTGEIGAIVDAAEEAIIKAGLGVYQRGGEICYVGETKGRDSAGKEIKGQAIVELGVFALQEVMSTSSLWEKWDARADKFVYCNAPMDIARTLKERTGRLTLPILGGFANAPTLRSDGSILEKEGFDEQSGLLLNFFGARFPGVPEEPSKDEALAALELLNGLLVGFPFVREDHRSAALSMLLSAAVRKSLPFCPIHGVTASTPGTGKSLLADLPAIMLTGENAMCATWSGDKNEDRKSLHAMLYGGSSTIHLDNVEEGAEVGGSFLNTMLTSERMQVRVLGSSSTPIVNTNTFITATGNKLVFVADMSRRTVFCALEANCERPETREFGFNPATMLHDYRGDYVVAALTVLRAVHVAGYPPHGKSPLGGFDLWEKWIRGGLIWLGVPDPVLSQDDVREMDPARIRHLSLLESWYEVFGSDRKKSRDVLGKSNERDPSTQDATAPYGHYRHPALRDAVVAVAQAGPDRADSTKLGYYVKAMAGRICNGKRFVKAGELNGSAAWKVEIADEVDGGKRPAITAGLLVDGSGGCQC